MDVVVVGVVCLALQSASGVPTTRSDLLVTKNWIGGGHMLQGSVHCDELRGWATMSDYPDSVAEATKKCDSFRGDEHPNKCDSFRGDMHQKRRLLQRRHAAKKKGSEPSGP